MEKPEVFARADRQQRYDAAWGREMVAVVVRTEYAIPGRDERPWLYMVADVQRARVELEDGIEALLKAFHDATGLWPRVTAGEAVAATVDVEVRL